jgi:hypothetical protein
MSRTALARWLRVMYRAHRSFGDSPAVARRAARAAIYAPAPF